MESTEVQDPFRVVIRLRAAEFRAAIVPGRGLHDGQETWEGAAFRRLPDSLQPHTEFNRILGVGGVCHGYFIEASPECLERLRVAFGPCRGFTIEGSEAFFRLSEAKEESLEHSWNVGVFLWENVVGELALELWEFAEMFPAQVAWPAGSLSAPSSLEQRTWLDGQMGAWYDDREV